MNTVVADPIVERLGRELRAHYGARLKQILLYGSRARGDFNDESDYDVIVVLEPPINRWAESDQLSSISTQLTFDTGAVASIMPLTEAQIQERTGFMRDVRRDGRPI